MVAEMIPPSSDYSPTSRESVADPVEASVADQPLWLQAQHASAQGTAHGTAHGTAAIPCDLREAFAMSTWPGSPELRRIFLSSADKAVLSAARHLARTEITDTCDRIGGIRTDPTTKELTEASADMLEWEYIRSQKEHAYVIDCGPDPRLMRFH